MMALFVYLWPSLPEPKPMSTIEDGLSAVEFEVHSVKRQLANMHQRRERLDLIAGAMTAWPEFEDVLQLGRAFRQSVCDATGDDAYGG